MAILHVEGQGSSGTLEESGHVARRRGMVILKVKDIQVGKDQVKAQRESLSKNRDGEKLK